MSTRAEADVRSARLSRFREGAHVADVTNRSEFVKVFRRRGTTEPWARGVARTAVVLGLTLGWGVGCSEAENSSGPSDGALAGTGAQSSGGTSPITSDTGGTGAAATGGTGGAVVGVGATGGTPSRGGIGGSGGTIDPPVVCELDQQRVYDDVEYLASDELRGREPGDIGSELAVQFAEDQFAEAGLLPGGDNDTYRQAFEFASGQYADNVLAVIPGNDPVLQNEVIVVGAHIDHLGVGEQGEIYRGADDNASGAAVVLELARMFSRCGLSPKRTLLFAEWNAEEKGIIGSRYFVEHPTFPLEDIIAAYNFDMVGAGDGTGVLLFGGHDEKNLFLTKLMEGAAEEAQLPYTIEIVPQKLASDHAPFVEKGVPICWGFARPDPHPGYHTPDDGIENIQPESLKVVTELFWAALRPLAMGEEERYIE